MADIFLDTLTYYKDEIDQQNTIESIRVDTELNKKIDVLDKGVPGGVATLNAAGDVETTQIPFATQTEADDETNDFRVISPLTLKHVLRDYINTQDADELRKALSIQVSLGIDIDTIFTNGEYEVDTNLPNSIATGRLKVQEVYGTSRVIQAFKPPNMAYRYEREYTGSVWSAWALYNN